MHLGTSWLALEKGTTRRKVFSNGESVSSGGAESAPDLLLGPDTASQGNLILLHRRAPTAVPAIHDAAPEIADLDYLDLHDDH
jgi:hypothetical protein